MRIIFYETKNDKKYNKISIEFLEEDNFIIPDLIKDDVTTTNISYVWSSFFNKLLKVNNFVFENYDKPTGIINMRRNTELHKDDFNNILQFNKLEEFELDSEEIEETLFNSDIGIDVKYLDMKKYNDIKDMCKDYDSIKFVEYNDYDDNNIVKTIEDCVNIDKKYTFDLSLSVNVLVIETSTNTLYNLTVPLGTPWDNIGIDRLKIKFVEYTDDINYNEDKISIDLSKCIQCNMFESTNYILTNTIVYVDTIDKYILNKYNKNLKLMMEIDCIIDEIKL